MILRLLIVIGIFAASVVLPAMVIYLRDMFAWKRAFHDELSTLTRYKNRGTSARRKAVRQIENTCRHLMKGRPQGKDIKEIISRDLKSLAALFHPESPTPTLCVTPAHITLCVQESLEHLDRIMARPGFSLLAGQSLTELEHLNTQFRQVITPGPLGRPPLATLFQLIGKTRLLFFARYLVADLYLYLACLFLNLYGERSSYLMDEQKLDLEQTLRELSRFKMTNGAPQSPELQDIRNTLVGIPNVLVNEPGFSRWKDAVMQAANAIARDFFPQSASPLTEAKVGPLLSRTRNFLSRLGSGEGYSMASRAFKIRLETLFQAKSISQTLIPPQVRRILLSTQKTYGWLKWPLNVYMMASKGIFWKIAVDVGWFAGRKAILVLIFGKSFDKAVEELDAVYRLSAGKEIVRPAPVRQITDRRLL